MKKIFVFLALAMSFFSMQSVYLPYVYQEREAKA